VVIKLFSDEESVKAGFFENHGRRDCRRMDWSKTLRETSSWSMPVESNLRSAKDS